MAEKVFSVGGIAQDGGSAEMTLADMMGVDLSNVEAVAPGFYLPPAGLFNFQGKDIETLEINDKPAIAVVCTIVEVHELAASGGDPNEPLGKEHREICFWPGDEDGLTQEGMGKLLGNLKHFLQHVGLEGNMTVSAARQAFEGHIFTAPIKVDADRKDPDRKYARIVREKARPVRTEEVAAAE